jgi:hypothetical protein
MSDSESIVEDWEALAAVERALVRLAQEQGVELPRADDRMSPEELRAEAAKFGKAPMTNGEVTAAQREKQRQADLDFLWKLRAASVNDLLGDEPDRWPVEIRPVYDGITQWAEEIRHVDDGHKKTARLNVGTLGTSLCVNVTLRVVRNAGKWYSKPNRQATWEGLLRRQLQAELKVGKPNSEQRKEKRPIFFGKKVKLHDGINEVPSKDDSTSFWLDYEECCQKCLTDLERQLLEDRYIWDVSYEEIGQWRSISEHAAKLRVLRALAKLRTCMLGEPPPDSV